MVSETKNAYTVITSEGKKYQAKVLARDPLSDIAILKIEDGDALPFLSLGDSALYQIGLHADYAIMPAVHLRAGIDYMQFDYGASPWVTDTLYGGWIAEPDSSTRLTTIDAGVACSF